MVSQGNLLTIEGWVMNGYTPFTIDPGGDIVLTPLIIIFADHFWNARGQPLALPSEPIAVEFTQLVARQKTVWTLGERLKATGQPIAVNATKARQQPAVRKLREQILTLDRNGLRPFRTGLLRRDEQLARAAQWQEAYRQGEIGLNTLQIQENRIFGREGPSWLKLLARMHDKQLTVRRRALPALLKDSRTLYLLHAPRDVARTQALQPRFTHPRPKRHARAGATRTLFALETREPTVNKNQTLTPTRRAGLLAPLHRFRQEWLRAGRPAAMLPHPAPDLVQSQQDWLHYEEAKQ